ncbi:MAG: hypothetical protein ABI353_24130 [Isosphaeraceae bacterium]
MRWLSTIRRVGFAAALAALAAGCGSSGSVVVDKDDPMGMSSLTELGEAYRFYTLKNKRPPQKATEIDELEMMSPNGVIAARQGDVVVEWGVNLTDVESSEPGAVKSDQVLAYQKQAPEEGGYVLLLDRTVKKMSAEEFKAAPKASSK